MIAWIFFFIEHILRKHRIVSRTFSSLKILKILIIENKNTHIFAACIVKFNATLAPILKLIDQQINVLQKSLRYNSRIRIFSGRMLINLIFICLKLDLFRYCFQQKWLTSCLIYMLFIWFGLLKNTILKDRKNTYLDILSIVGLELLLIHHLLVINWGLRLDDILVNENFT